MHYCTQHIVYARTPEDAKDKAIANAENICEVGGYYDWADTDEGRWEECLKPVLATSVQGKKQIEETFEGQMTEKRRYMSEVIAAVARGDIESRLFGENADSMVRYYFQALGSDDNVRLFDDDGSGIADEAHLKNALEKWPDLKETHEGLKDVDVYVVAVDMHS